MKYVILTGEFGGVTRVYPFIFPEYVTHSTVGNYMAHGLRRVEDKHTTVTAAGFCSVDADGLWSATRGSESLNIPKDASKDAEDARILNMPNACQGIVL